MYIYIYYRKIKYCNNNNNNKLPFLSALLTKFTSRKLQERKIQRACAQLATGREDLALLTCANVNTAIPSQLETLNALDSVQYQGLFMQLMWP